MKHYSKYTQQSFPNWNYFYLLKEKRITMQTWNIYLRDAK